jgi:hypothetical protein
VVTRKSEGASAKNIRQSEPFGDNLRRIAIARALAACESLSAMGVVAKITGSLATGHFRAGSDVDFLIADYPPSLKYRIEGVVEDCLGGIPFDVIYLDEIPARKLARATREAVDARDLR